MTARQQLGSFQAYHQAPWRIQLQTIGVFSLAVVMIGVVAGIYLNITARAATFGREIQGLQSDRLEVERINADLETQLAQLTTASAMEDRAVELGFRRVSHSEITYIVVEGYYGRQEAVLAPPPGPAVSDMPELPPEYTQTLLDWFRGYAIQGEDFGQTISLLQQAELPAEGQP
jgi:hypothetical protein